jgi:hypothetical protein
MDIINCTERRTGKREEEKGRRSSKKKRWSRKRSKGIIRE